MNGFIVHPLTQRQIDAFICKPSHAVLLVGPVGSGKLTLATQLIEQVLELPVDGFRGYAYGTVVRPVEGKAIGIESIRELEHFLSLKVPRQTPYNRAVIIADSQLLTLEAQNALLKTLEQPPANTIILLTASNEQALLPTIRSRTQMISLQRPDYGSVEKHFESQGFDDQQIKQAHAVSDGLPGLMHALLTQTDHPLLAATEHARQLLSQPSYVRLLAVDELARQRALACDVVAILQQMAHVSLQTATGGSANKWRAVLQASYDAAEALDSNAQPKLALTNLMLRF